MKKNIIIFIAVLVVIAGIIAVNPWKNSNKKPNRSEKVISEGRAEHECPIAGYQWCPSTEECQKIAEVYCEEYEDQYKGD